MGEIISPQKWEKTPLSLICEVVRGVTFKKADSISFSKEGFFPVLRANGIQNGKLLFNDLVYVPCKMISDKQLISNGDIVIAMSSGSKLLVGKAAQAKKDYLAGFGAFCGILRPNKLMNPSYIGYFFQSKEYRNKVAKLSAGVNINNLKPSHFDEIIISIAPQNEQARIADKLDELLAQVDTIKVRIDAIPNILKRFRQSVLAAAMRGKLTEEWRKEHSNLPRLAIFFEELNMSRVALKVEKKLKKKFGLHQKLTPLFDSVPESWMWVGFEDISANENNALKAGPFGSALKKIDCVASGYRVYGQEQVIADDETLVTYYVDEGKYQQLSSCRVAAGDILISLVGTIGKVLILSKGVENGIINPRLVKLSLQPRVSREFIKYYLDSPYAHDFFRSYSHGGTMEILNLGILKELPICFPPFEEQEEIVKSIKGLFIISDKIEQGILEAKSRINNLTQSILAKAFRGELVPQDPNDEPASELLARIQKEREAVTTLSKLLKKKL